MTTKPVNDLLTQVCPGTPTHRDVWLTLARTKDGAPQCSRHGSTFDVSGMVNLLHHPFVEARDVVWTDGGGRQTQPFPRFSFTELPAGRIVAIIADCN